MKEAKQSGEKRDRAKQSEAGRRQETKNKTTYNSVLSQWETSLRKHLQLCNSCALIDELLQKYGPLETAVDAWDFKDIPWIVEVDSAQNDSVIKQCAKVVAELAVAGNVQMDFSADKI